MGRTLRMMLLALALMEPAMPGHGPTSMDTVNPPPVPARSRIERPAPRGATPAPRLASFPIARRQAVERASRH